MKYGVVTNNYVLRSKTDAENALVTFGYEGSGEGEKVKLKPEIKLSTEKVSTVCACDPMQIAFEGFQNFVKRFRGNIPACNVLKVAFHRGVW